MGSCSLGKHDASELPRPPNDGGETIKKLVHKARCRRNRTRPHHEIARLQAEVSKLERLRVELLVVANKSTRDLLHAREENAALKDKLRRCLGSTASFQQKLQEEGVEEEEEQHLGALPCSVFVVGGNLAYDEAQDAALFDMLSQTVDEHYWKIDHVLQKAGMLNSAEEMEDACVLQPTGKDRDAGGAGILKSWSSGLLPFSDQAVNESLWHELESQSVVANDQLQAQDLGLALGLASRLVVTKRRLVLNGSDEHGDVSCTIWIVLKRFVEEDRVVHVWEAMGHWPRVGRTEQVSTREHGWGLVRSLKQVSVPHEDISIVQSCVYVTPTLGASSTGSSDQWDRSDAPKVVIQCYQRILDWRLQLLQNKVMDKALQRKGKPNGSGQEPVGDVC